MQNLGLGLIALVHWQIIKIWRLDAKVNLYGEIVQIKTDQMHQILQKYCSHVGGSGSMFLSCSIFYPYYR